MHCLSPTLAAAALCHPRPPDPLRPPACPPALLASRIAGVLEPIQQTAESILVGKLGVSQASNPPPHVPAGSRHALLPPSPTS